MMYNYVCEDDLMVYSVNRMDPSIKILPVVIGCPKCRKDITVAPNFPARSQVLILTAEELFRAANGLPLPPDESASEARVSHLLLNGKITGVKLISVDQDRVIIESISVKYLEQNHTLHFATSTKGATIFKVSNY